MYIKVRACQHVILLVSDSLCIAGTTSTTQRTNETNPGFLLYVCECFFLLLV